jgi:D-beta-D-heptose 7-phosphate kinase/D-beta-D-heptose 1-phosphate adenosyltransferase
MPSISDLSKARIVVVGDAMVDVWVHGRVDRISPEAPVPVFVEEWREERAGGAGNVIANLMALGCLPGDFDTKNAPRKTRYVVNNQQIFRSDLEDCTPISQAEEDYIVRSIASEIDVDVLIISDYAKGVCTPSLCQRLIKWAKEQRVTVVVDPKGDDWSKYEGAYVITPNEREWQATPNEPDTAIVVITQGAAGMRILPPSNEEIHIAATNTGPVDVTGAGDTVVAVLSAAIAVGFDLESAARLANAAAGIVVGRFGTATCTIEELEAAYEKDCGASERMLPIAACGTPSLAD